MRHVALRLTFAVAVAVGACGGARAAIESLPPLALRGTNPRWISGGVYSALAAEGRFGGFTPPPRARANGVTDLSKGKPPAVLDARVGANVRLGDDPAALPAAQRGQAEPHLARSTTNPDLLLATFQEGRFATGGGSADCGYALSRDGGFTWTRALIPQLTAISSGLYRRATDPVAGIGPQGDLYLTTLASLDDAFNSVDLVVSRSTDGGVNWSAPAIAFHQTTALAAPDKNWLAVNDYPGAANPGRLVATWTNFTSTAAGASTGNNLLATVSDDRGVTWSAPITITPAGSLNQGSQPLFLPDGSLVVIYATFANLNSTITFSLQCKRSTDGGLTFPAPATTAVSLVNGYNDPDLRNGLFLPSATIARTNGEIFVTYVAVVAGTPRVMVTKSSDQGATWTAPVIASDNPAGTAVDNPAIAVTPDGQAVSIVFLDKRNSPVTTDGRAYFIDHYAAQSFDGGATWQPNLRLSELTSDIRYAALTSQGYMLGDYLAIAPSLIPDPISSRQPCVAIWCDTRTGNADPFTVRFAPASTSDYEAWCTVNKILQVPAVSDQDGDGVVNFLEYADGSDPRRPDLGEDLFIRRPDATTLDVAWAQRAEVRSPWGDASLSIFPGPDFTKIPILGGNLRGADLAADQLPKVPLRAGLVWRGMRTTTSAGAVYGVARSFRVTLGQTTPSQGEAILTIGTESRLTNLSSRGQVGTGGNQMIVGFVLDGSKTMLLRAAGPALGAFGISNPLADPRLLLEALASDLQRSNDNWEQGGGATDALFTRLGAFPFALGGLDAALTLQLGPQAYTATISGADNGTGIALAEAYDADATPGATTNPRLLNISTRANVGTGANALVAGFALRGTQPRRILVRAVGPSLTQFGLAGVLADPVLTLYQDNTVLATNDDWEISRSSAAIAATAQNVGAFALNAASLDSALLITLAPGNYTAVVTGANGTTGLALVEVYDAN